MEKTVYFIDGLTGNVQTFKTRLDCPMEIFKEFISVNGSSVLMGIERMIGPFFSYESLSNWRMIVHL